MICSLEVCISRSLNSCVALLTRCPCLRQQLCTAQNVNCRDLEGRHSTPLHFAAGYNRVAVVEYLLHHGADVHAKDKGLVWSAPFCWMLSCFLTCIRCFQASHHGHTTLLFLCVSPVVWFPCTTPAPMVTMKWRSCWSDTELRST